jgi:hypothetical protein
VSLELMEAKAYSGLACAVVHVVTGQMCIIVTEDKETLRQAFAALSGGKPMLEGPGLTHQVAVLSLKELQTQGGSK